MLSREGVVSTIENTRRDHRNPRPVLDRRLADQTQSNC